MDDRPPTAPNPKAAVSSTYRLLRWLIRLWVTLLFRAIRLLHADALSDSERAILVVNHPAGFFEALLLVATFHREVHCLLERKLARSLLGRFFAQGLGMVLYESESEGGGWQPALEACSAALAGGSAVAIFAQAGIRKGLAPPGFAVAAASLALRAESQGAGEGPSVYPVHVFLPVAPSTSTELLIYVDTPLSPQPYLAPGGGEPRERAFALAINGARSRNPFRLQPAEFARFLSDLEEVLRCDLAEDWSSRPNWKQTVEGFELSRSVRDWAHQLNHLQPGRLLALRESLDRYREAQRALSLRRLQVELGAPWVQSPWRRTAVWVESVAELPVAAYGLANHLAVGVILLAAGRLKKASAAFSKSVWGWRAAVALGCYALQTWACARSVGWAGAGYYAASLPLSAACALRYRWLLQHRTRLLVSAAGLPARGAKLARQRKRLLSELGAALDASMFPALAAAPGREASQAVSKG